MQIPKNSEAGTWWVSVLSLSDKAANTSTIGYTAAAPPLGGQLRVVSSASDTAPPTLRGIRLSKPSIAAGDTNVVLVDVIDDRSGVATVYGTFESPQKSGLLVFAAQAGGPGEPFSGRLAIPNDAACGTWRLREMHMADKANNHADLNASNAIVAGATMSIYAPSGKCDDKAPEVRGVSVSPHSLSNLQDSSATISIDITDDSSGVSSVSGHLAGPKPPGGGQPPMIWFSAAAGATPGPWMTQVIIPKLSSKGTWRVGYLQVADVAHNIRYYNDPKDPVFNGASIEVY